MKICLLSNSGDYGNAPALAEGLKRFAQVTTIFHRKGVKGYDKTTDVNYHVPIPEADHYIVMAAISLPMLPGKLWDKGVTFILTDSTYMKNPDKYNRIIKKHNWNVWAMPDLCKYGGWDNVYYQPFIMPDIDTRKTGLVCHSPFCDVKMKEKGTAVISNICSKHNLPLKIITDKTWEETLLIKAKYRIFIDQIYRGLGKSGLEAMLLDCAVLSGVKPDVKDLPPITWTDKNNLEEDLIELLSYRDRREKIIKEQRQWAEKNLDPVFVARKIIDSIV